MDNLFEGLPKQNLGLVKNPFSSNGRHKRCVTLMSFFLDNKPKRKIDILENSGILKDKKEVKSKVYYSSYFQALSRIRALRYDSLTLTWSRGENYQAYLAYIIESMTKSEAKDKLANFLSQEQIKKLDTDLAGVVQEVLEDKAAWSTLRILCKGDMDNVVDFILND